MNICTSLCECSNNCIGRADPNRYNRTAPQQLNKTFVDNRYVVEARDSQINNDDNRLMSSLTVIEFKDLLKKTILEYQVDFMRQIHALIQQQQQQIQQPQSQHNGTIVSNTNEVITPTTNPQYPSFQSPLDFSILSPMFLLQQNQ
jgi:regulator of PEP synthase PpsR (kinase-PPPase family)